MNVPHATKKTFNSKYELNSAFIKEANFPHVSTIETNVEAISSSPLSPEMKGSIIPYLSLVSIFHHQQGEPSLQQKFLDFR